MNGRQALLIGLIIGLILGIGGGYSAAKFNLHAAAPVTTTASSCTVPTVASQLSQTVPDKALMDDSSATFSGIALGYKVDSGVQLPEIFYSRVDCSLPRSGSQIFAYLPEQRVESQVTVEGRVPGDRNRLVRHAAFTPVFSSKTNTLAYAISPVGVDGSAGRSQSSIVVARSNNVMKTITGGSGDALTPISWSPDGTKLLFETNFPTVTLKYYDTAADKITTITNPTGVSVNQTPFAGWQSNDTIWYRAFGASTPTTSTFEIVTANLTTGIASLNGIKDTNNGPGAQILFDSKNFFQSFDNAVDPDADHTTSNVATSLITTPQANKTIATANGIFNFLINANTTGTADSIAYSLWRGGTANNLATSGIMTIPTAGGTATTHLTAPAGTDVVLIGWLNNYSQVLYVQNNSSTGLSELHSFDLKTDQNTTLLKNLTNQS